MIETAVEQAAQMSAPLVPRGESLEEALELWAKGAEVPESAESAEMQ